MGKQYILIKSDELIKVTFKVTCDEDKLIIMKDFLYEIRELKRNIVLCKKANTTKR